MARITLSPLIVDVRASVGDTVFSKWKGLNYIRSRVVPANPNTQAQQDVRNSMARCVDFWQALPLELKGAWNYVAQGRNYSGYNRFTSENRATEEALNLLQISGTTGVVVLTSWTAIPGSGSGEIDVSFVPDPVPGSHTLHVIAREDPIGTEKNVTVFTFTFAAAQASPITLTGLVAGTTYQIYGCLEDDALSYTGTGSSSSATATV